MTRYSIYWRLTNSILTFYVYGKIYLSSLNYSRFVNMFMLLITYVVSAAIRRPLVWGKPFSVSIEPINVCNLKCPECPTGLGILKRPKGMVSVESFSHTLSHLNKSLWHVNLYFQGEPFMHPEFFKLVEMAKKANLLTSTSTNAHFLSYSLSIKTVVSGLDTIIISFDGTTQEVYEKYRVGGNMNTVIKSVENLVRAKQELKSKTPVIVAQFLAFNYNEHQIKEFKKLAFSKGVNKVEVKTAQIYEVEKKVDMLPSNGNLSRYKVQVDGSVKLKGNARNRCWKHWSSAVITWDGRVAPCCFDKDVKNTFGNVIRKDISKIWNNSEYNVFRQKVLLNKDQIDICSNCPIGRKY